MAESQPPPPYARVRIARYQTNVCHTRRSVPLHWLQDWRQTLLHPAARCGETDEAPSNARTFLCFYSPAGFAARPAFAGVRHGTLAEWNDGLAPDAGAALFRVHVVNVVRAGHNRLQHLRHARVRLVSDGTELLVPVGWMDLPNWVRVDEGGAVIDPGRLYWCYYDGDSTAESYGWAPKMKRLHYFREGVCAWYRVKVLQVFEGGLKNDNDSDSDDDNCSAFSADTANDFDGASGSDRFSDTQAEDAHTLQGDEKLSAALEDCGAKSAVTRSNALATICDVLAQHYLPEQCESLRMTIVDQIERSLRRGKAAEQAPAAHLVPLLAIQLGDAEELVPSMSPLLLHLAQDDSAAALVRARCCSALALLTVMNETDAGDALQMMRAMETIFAGAYRSATEAEASVLHCAALAAWALVLTLIAAGDFCSMMLSGTPGIPSMPKLMSLLQSKHLEVRLTAGETIALVLEIGRAHDTDFLAEHQPELIDQFQQLATDTQKFRAKRDLKTQRATFRTMLQFVEEDKLPKTTIHFGAEKLVLGSWEEQTLYAALVRTIGQGMTVQLTLNEFLRDRLDLGPRPLKGAPPKVTRYTQKLINAASYKVRSMQRNNARKVKNF